MTKQEKMQVVDELKSQFSEYPHFYVTDSSTLTVAEVNELRRLCYERNVKMRVVKNTLAKIALEASGGEQDLEGLFDTLSGPTALMFTEVANGPAKVIKEFNNKNKKPEIKAAFIDNDVFLGDNLLESLSALKSKEELLGDIISLLQSPIKNVISSLQSGENTLSGIVKTLEERAE